MKKPKIALISGSARSANNCPGEYGKTRELVLEIINKIPNEIDLDFIDLAVEPNKPIVMPCKACVSTANGYHCIDGSQRVFMADGSLKPICEVEAGDFVFPDGQVTRAWQSHPYAQIYLIKLSDGRQLKATSNHRIKIGTPIKTSTNSKKYNIKGYEYEWKRVEELSVGDRVPVVYNHQFPKKRNMFGNALRRDFKFARKQHFGVVTSIEPAGCAPVYDLTVEPTHEFIVEGITVHNCHFPCDCYGPMSVDPSVPDFMHRFKIYNRLKRADAFILFTPVNWYSVPTSVKAFFDRMVCVNLTLPAEFAQEVGLGKNPDKTRAAEKQRLYENKIKNHYEGKYAAFFCHGDAGADDYVDRPIPASLRLNPESSEFQNPVNAVMPIVNQCRYSGIFVPDEWIVGWIINEGVPYSVGNDIFKADLEQFKQSAFDLVLQVSNHILNSRA